MRFPSQCNQHFCAIEGQKGTLMASLADVPEVRLRTRPAAASWSLVEIVDHLAKVECELVADAESRLGSDRAKSVTVSESVGAWMVRTVMNSRLKIKTPPSANRVLPGDPALLDLRQISESWSLTRGRLACLLHALTDFPVRHPIFRHPVSGRMTARQGIRFIEAHFSHHLPQIERALRTQA